MKDRKRLRMDFWKTLIGMQLTILFIAEETFQGHVRVCSNLHHILSFKLFLACHVLFSNCCRPILEIRTSLCSRCYVEVWAVTTSTELNQLPSMRSMARILGFFHKHWKVFLDIYSIGSNYLQCQPSLFVEKWFVEKLKLDIEITFSF